MSKPTNLRIYYRNDDQEFELDPVTIDHIDFDRDIVVKQDSPLFSNVTFSMTFHADRDTQELQSLFDWLLDDGLYQPFVPMPAPRLSPLLVRWVFVGVVTAVLLGLIIFGG